MFMRPGFLSACAAMTIVPMGLFAENGGPPKDQGFIQTLIMLSIAVLFFYIILFRPEQKRRKAMEQQRESMKKGDTVTAMGIVGTVSKVQENTVILRMVDGAKIEMLKAAISEVMAGKGDDKGDDKGDE